MRGINAVAPGNTRILSREASRKVSVRRAAGHIVKGTKRRRRSLIAELIGRRVHKGIHRRPDIARNHLAVAKQRVFHREAACRRGRCSLEHNTSIVILIGSCIRKLDAVIHRIHCIVSLRCRRECRGNRHCNRRTHASLVPAEEVITVLCDRR